MRKNFHLDKRNGNFMGVCAGIANYFGFDATIVRIGAVVADPARRGAVDASSSTA